MKPIYATGSVPSLSGHATQLRTDGVHCRESVLSASLSHTHYWYEVGMLKVPADDGTAS